jgi:hypothetical protein
VDDPGDVGAPDGGGGGIVSFLTSIRGVVSTIAALVVAISGLIAALNQVGIIGDDGTPTTIAATTIPQPTTTNSEPATLFRSIKRPNGRVEFEGDVMYVHASRPARPLLHLADLGEPISDMSIGVRTEWVSGADDYGFGLICRYENQDNYYLLSVLSGGRYKIIRYSDGKPKALRSGTDSGASEGANDVKVKCTGDDPTTLTLTINKRPVATARDEDGIAEGIVGVRVGSTQLPVTLRFENFVLTEL